LKDTDAQMAASQGLLKMDPTGVPTPDRYHALMRLAVGVLDRVR